MIAARHYLQTERIFRRAHRLLEAERVRYRADTRCGPPASEIALHARESHYDGIIMGTRGLGPVPSVMIGSVDVPVTLVK